MGRALARSPGSSVGYAAASTSPIISPRRLRRSMFAGAAIAAAVTVTTLHIRHSTSTISMSAASPTTSLSDLTGLKDIEGNPLDAAVFAGKVIFAMNVASACGYTKPGYDLLNRLTGKYGPDDFVAVAIPCNSFGWQENGSPDEIKTFALARAQKLIITERSVVNGGDPHPVIALAKQAFPGRIAWNFDGRFVFDRQGKPVARFDNSASTEQIEKAIDELI